MAKQYMVHIQLVAVCNSQEAVDDIEAEARKLGAYAHDKPALGGMQCTRGVREMTDNPAHEVKALADAMKPLVVDEETAYQAAEYLAKVAGQMGVTVQAMAVKLSDEKPAGGNSSLN